MALKVMMDFSDYKPWSGAVDTYEIIEASGKLDALEDLLEELYPDGIEEVQINDILWFDSDWVFESLGIKTEEEVEEELEEYEDFEDLEEDEDFIIDSIDPEKEWKCCICGKKFSGYGNNPWPLKKEGICCDKCNEEKVIPYRIETAFGTKKAK